jgi:spermidine synthase
MDWLSSNNIIKKFMAGLVQIQNHVLKGLTFMLEEKKPEIIYDGDSEINHVTITELNGIRTMFLGNPPEEAETSISIKNPEAPIFEYPGMVLLSLALRPQARKIVMLGLGGGYIPALFQKYLPDHQLTVVEIDPLIVDLAYQYFGFSAGGNVRLEISDGLDFLARQSPRSFDLIWLDAFNGKYIPAHLSTAKFLELNRLILKDDGLLVQNLHQTRLYLYHRQLALTSEAFDLPSLIFTGKRCANAIVISPTGPNPLSRQPKEMARAVRSFGNKIGPYDLMDEIRKLAPFPVITQSQAGWPPEARTLSGQ